jgi:hypothetical protein
VRLPFGSTIPLAALALSLVLLASAQVSNLLAAGAALALGVVIYRLRRPVAAGSAFVTRMGD